MQPQEEQDYTARQLLSTLWMRPELIPVAAQQFLRDDLLSPVPAYIWHVLRAHVANGKLDLPKALAALDSHQSALAFWQRGQQENYYPQRYGEQQIESWARELAEAGYRRLGAVQASRIQERINDVSQPLDEVISDAVMTFSNLRGGQGGTWRDMPDIARGVRAIRRAWEDGLSVASELTGYRTFDRILGGFRVGELSIIAARPSMGKTAFALGIAVNIAQRYKREGEGRVVAFFSAETSGELLFLRMAYALAGVDQTASRNGETSDEEEERVEWAIDLLESLPIYIDESPAPTTDNMLIRAMGLNSVVMDGQKQQVGIAFFDFVELAGEQDEVEERRISKIARGLKAIAKLLPCPVVALSQLNRDAEPTIPTGTGKGSKKATDLTGSDFQRTPELKHLRYSGMLEQLAYAVVFLHRPAYYAKRANPDYNPYAPQHIGMHKLAVAMIAKNKDGRTGPVAFTFEEEFARFSDPQDPPSNGW